MMGLQAHPLSQDCASHWSGAEREEERLVPQCLEPCNRLDPPSGERGLMAVTHESHNLWRHE